MEKKITISDVATHAGVSVATVSYVINNRQDQSIKPETRQKVWQIVNLLNYKPSVYAKNLRSTPSSKLVGIYACHSTNALRQVETFDLMSALARSFEDNSTGVLLLNSSDTNTQNADVVIALSLTKDEFYRLGKNNFVPIVSVDSLINDPLFFQVTTDFLLLRQRAEEQFGSDFTFVCIKQTNQQLENEILEIFDDVVFVDTIADINMPEIKSNVLTLNSVVNGLLKTSHNVFFAEEFVTSKALMIASCVNKALSRQDFNVHFYKS